MKLEITLVKSPIAAKPNHKKTVAALGLRKIGQKKIYPDNPAMRGMIFTVQHLLKVQEVE